MNDNETPQIPRRPNLFARVGYSLEPNTFGARMWRLQKAYRRGADVRASLLAHDQEINPEAVRRAYIATGEIREADSNGDGAEFKALYADYFAAGVNAEPYPG